MKQAYLILITSLLLVGCTSTRTIQLDSSTDFTVINEEAQKRNAYVTFRDGSEAVVYALSISHDIASGQPQGGSFQSWPTDSIFRVRFLKSDKGARQGLGIGFGLGALTGALIGLGSGDDDTTGFGFAWTAEEKALIGTIFLGPLGAVFGAIKGALEKAKDDFIFQPYPNTPTGDSGSQSTTKQGG